MTLGIKIHYQVLNLLLIIINLINLINFKGRKFLSIIKIHQYFINSMFLDLL